MNKLPVVRLDVDSISDAVASKLATSLLGHILFLKNQVPLPVMQLSRLPVGKSTARALKQRNELLASFDTLSSHLDTTFTALSTAFARRNTNSNEDIVSNNHKTSRAYLAILVGPSVGSAKSKVIYAVDGLQMKVWGERSEKDHQEVDVEGEVEDIEDEDDDKEKSDDESEEGSGDEPEESGDEEGSEEEEEHDDHDEEDTQSSLPTSPPPPYVSHAEEQRFLQTADRLLSRTLAAFDAEEDGCGFGSEMSPTQTHILIRAPRRFSHPAWIPRQNVTTSLESTLSEFWEESGMQAIQAQNLGKIKPRKKGNRVEGVWVTSREGLGRASDIQQETDLQEEDEMIWWSWDGRIVGFNDW
ncbi:hypothetical protein BDQ12DRAFT_612282 [Crucibulum laeve]|uniref:Uncharacterized protein n=1 Tax=Crucibulum laeve TaxID=68775 RepID=A0A5C3LR59_9AGAR|nr:hypothetical protein BDQ12DRAFT_612282 [Crucibulum laeve]